jgi:hypothetical protein
MREAISACCSAITVAGALAIMGTLLVLMLMTLALIVFVIVAPAGSAGCLPQPVRMRALRTAMISGFAIG